VPLHHIQRALALALAVFACGAAACSIGSSDPDPARPAKRPQVRATPAPPPSCERKAAPTTFAAQWKAAKPGETLCLATGDYGVFTALPSKPGRVTVRSQPGARASMEVNFWRAQNVTLDGLTIRGGQFTGSTTKHITIRNSRFTKMLIFRETEAGVLSDADVVLDHNSYRDIMLPKASYAGRISLIYDLPPGRRSGVTISNSLFSGGNTDGIQTSVGVDIIDNEFADLREKNAKDTAHTDSIQLLGAPGSIIRGNYFHGVATGIVAYDGVTGATIEDNVIETDRPWGIELYADQGSTIRHNTLRYGRCIFHLPCAQIDLTRKLVNAPGRGTRILDNVVNAINASEGSTYAQRSHNLVQVAPSRGDLRGTASFVGGARPTSYDGYGLAPGSPGKGAASDGLDVGARIDARR
jgi:Right handed beta helix region